MNITVPPQKKKVMPNEIKHRTSKEVKNEARKKKIDDSVEQ